MERLNWAHDWKEYESYKVIVAANFHYMDESESYSSGEYTTIEDAIIKCKIIVDDYILSAYQPGMSSNEL